MVFSLLENQLKEAAEWSLSRYLISNAIFLSERLLAEPSPQEEDREAKLNLLARCFLAEQSPHKMILLLKGSESAENAYLYALALFQVSSYDEAEGVLMRRSGSLGADGFFLLGQICERQSRFQDAVGHYQRALRQEPTLWSAFERLCKLGCPVEAYSAFGGKSSSPVQKLLLSLGEAYQALTQYKLDEAADLLHSLPDPQKNSGWGLCQLGRCYFEKYDFIGAIDYFQRGFQESPYRVEDIDIFSSALWYEKKSSELCYLLHNKLKHAYYAPQTWVTAGNFYSLQKERDTAIKCFNRAIQLNPFHSYAYCLCGHEHLANEDLEQAKIHYESAKNIDPRQYTALWGLGSLFFKQEKYTQSLECYKSARNINPQSSILLTYLGVNYKSLNCFAEAITCFNDAIKVDKKNPLPRFQLGVLLHAMNRDEEALEHLELLCKENARESHLYIQIGKIYAKLGKPDIALKYYNDAQELNPKCNTEVKNLIEQLHGTSSISLIPY